MLILKICLKCDPTTLSVFFNQVIYLVYICFNNTFCGWISILVYIYTEFFFRLLVLEVPFKCKVTPKEWGVPKITVTQARVEGGSFRDSSSLLGSCLRKSTLYKSDKWEPRSNPHEIVKCLMTIINPNAAYLYKNSPPQRETTHYNTHSC
jgi:hypothetical protein